MDTYIAQLRDSYLENLNNIHKVSDKDTLSEAVYSICRNIIVNITEKRSPEKQLNMNFSRIYRLADCSENQENEVQISLGILSSPNIDFLKWIYEANNIFNLDDSEKVIELSQSEVSDALLNEKYINPFNGQEISEEQYSKMINIVFSVSDNFIKKVNSSKGGVNS